MRIKQCERVVEYMRVNGSIDQLQALRDISVMRLASRISDLRKDGVKIKDRWKKGINKYGEEYKVKEYMLEG